ncbi:methyl-accepting chemotaxis protein [Paraburkholderia silvatlantica]|uniref:Aerotaxis receptor n=2 Tax=cellular organisms TaxID=131567 RepID=A0A2U1AAF5_9BURK|nr:PAS domain-containing methyl-accepting chemotaxis protein [Paraburkholderia silvatlantica]MBB2928186.1 aerotaxis receptor [Paraburkholderia silvatlantica]PVY31140.1 methyl-accepting chemotaxis sensory transducer with Pas/Pac sensor [Paraburkholderia silvatlantica]PXW37277.1 methyl-accepting chemotaxis sensory transducer with Pas/Pac sensor [Paraburkholderia silvatlantica]PYE19579.1 methyl-accepting chemotaxis sensory transducer with Pas/Pac sensor [Paraburkholderia silvatlantica]TDQ77483.1 
MRHNQPVTQREFEIPDDATLMSTTDTQSYINYANAAFIHASGFSEDEIQGQPHNLVRHPDMPQEAFADMWATLKGGEPWTALVKNRRKNGDHYWVRANAIPIVRDGRTSGYMSVRTKPAGEEIEAAESLYQQFREHKAGNRRFHKGLIIRTGLAGWTSALKTMPVRWRIRTSLLAAAPLILGAALLAGVRELSLAAFSAFVLACLLFLSLWLESQISRPLERVLEQALRVASGESQKAVHMDRVDEIGMTLRTISQLGLMFRWLIDDVSEQVITVERAIKEIAQGNNDLSKRTEQAASSVQQTASSMAQMSATVKGNAETAMQANTLSGSASHAAAKGGQAVADVINTMNEINTSSQRIADITGVIDGIAFQTNILALNAAVEAARAGETGRGFAVVAGEVRALAQRSANAAKEIKDLISASVEKVEIGSSLVDAAGKTMDEIVTQVKRVSDLIGEIRSATEEQSNGTSQIDKAVSDLDSITQQNAALVEQSTAASDSLRQQATRLVEAVSVFRS